VNKQNGKVAAPGHPGRFDVLFLPDGKDRASHQAGEARRVDHSQGDHQVGKPGSQDGHDADGQKNDRKGKDGIHDPHDDGIDPPPVIPADEAQEDARGDGHDDGEEPHPQGDRRAVYHPAEKVAPVAVGAEEMD
jgi:hypothetical protein